MEVSWMNFANLDFDRKNRTGFPEVIFCQGKMDDFLVDIYKKMYERDGEVFGTRASEHQYDIVKAVLPQVTYDKVSRILKITSDKEQKLIGNVAVVTAGTADIPVAEEAAQTIEYFGSKATEFTGFWPMWIH